MRIQRQSLPSLNIFRDLNQLLSLTRIDVIGNEIKNVNALSELKRLNTVCLGGNPIESISGLRGLDALQRLDIKNCNNLDIDEMIDVLHGLSRKKK